MGSIKIREQYKLLIDEAFSSVVASVAFQGSALSDHTDITSLAGEVRLADERGEISGLIHRLALHASIIAGSECKADATSTAGRSGSAVKPSALPPRIYQDAKRGGGIMKIRLDAFLTACSGIMLAVEPATAASPL